MHSVVSLFSSSKLNLIFKNLELSSIKSVLDVGCGNGFFTIPLKQKFNNITGLDFSKSMLSFIKGERLSLICADALLMPFKESSFDLVFSSNLLHHVTDIYHVLSQIKRISKKYIIIVEPNKQNLLMYLFSKLRKKEKSRQVFTLKGLESIILQERITVLDSFSTGSITPNQTPQLLALFLKPVNEMKNKFAFYNVIIGSI